MHLLTDIHLLSSGSMLASLVAIAWQDYASRAVQWIWFPLLACGGLLSGLPGINAGAAGINALLLLLQLAVLAAYFILRYGFRRTAMQEKIGAGDICFLLAACCCFSPLNYILFNVCSLLVTVLACLTGYLVRKPFGSSIPLAGLQASCLLLLLCGSWCMGYSLTDDALLIEKIVHL